MQPFNAITKTIIIQAPVSVVWKYLTVPELMKTWMLDEDMELEIISDWKVEMPFIMKGKIHDIDFENKGKIIKYQQEKTFAYSLLSSLSNLSDTEENYSCIEFDLDSMDSQTTLNIFISNFPEESIYRHLNFYWNLAIEGLKQQVEKDED
jgi:uncharacterized protein YndB with AHSA1/START domain